MPRTKKAKSEQEASEPDRPQAPRRRAVHGLAALALAGVCGAGLYSARQYVDEAVAPAASPPAVVFTRRPPWMSDLVATKLACTFRPKAGSSVFDREPLVTTAARLRASPWVSQLRQVRRVYGAGPGDRLEVDCEFRSPIALARYGPDYWFVDADGVKLPECFAADELPQVVFSPDGTTHLRLIEGVRHLPPRDAGQTWVGEDLAAGLELVGRLYGQSFAQEIVKVNVANFGGRVDPREAQVVLVTRYNTEIRWGRPWGATDAFIEVAPERKVQYLRRVLAEYGRVDARQPWIDIRFDRITYPDPAEAVGAEVNDTR